MSDNRGEGRAKQAKCMDASALTLCPSTLTRGAEVLRTTILHDAGIGSDTRARPGRIWNNKWIQRCRVSVSELTARESRGAQEFRNANFQSEGLIISNPWSILQTATCCRPACQALPFEASDQYSTEELNG